MQNANLRTVSSYAKCKVVQSANILRNFWGKFPYGRPPAPHSDSAGGQFRLKQIVLKPNFFIKTWQNRVFKVQFSNCWVIFMTKNFHTWKMKKMLLKKEQKNIKMPNFQVFCQLVSKLSLELQKIGPTDISHGKPSSSVLSKVPQKRIF